jgi:hypothetical protein
MASFMRLPKPLETGLAVIAAAVGLFALFSILTAPPQPRPPLDIVNGTWVSSDGGMLTMRDGKLSAGNASTTYVIETDKQGTYVLLGGRLLAEDGGSVRVEHHQDWMKSYLDEPASPSRISLWVWRSDQSTGPDLVVFDRRPEREPDVR